MRFDFDWVDAFTGRVFGGNGCAVVHGAAGLSDAQCIAYTRETSLSECTFTGPSDIADIRVRYFVAAGELPFAGHPTIATVAALRSRGIVTGDSVRLETGAGVIDVTMDGRLIEMTQVAPEFGAQVDPAAVAAIYGLDAEDIVGTPQVTSTGLPFIITVLRSQDALRRAQMDEGRFQAFRQAVGMADGPLTKPFLVTLEGGDDQGDTFSRLLMIPPGPAEDPFTGSATGAMAAYLWHTGLMDKDSFTAQQGHWMGRPGNARVTRVGSADAMTGIRVAGEGAVLMSGVVHFPDGGADG